MRFAACDVKLVASLPDNWLMELITVIDRDPRFVHGLSPRAALALLAAARAWAYLDERDLVLPEDVQAVFGSVATHRLRLAGGTGFATPDDLDAVVRRTPLP